jgi:hypothetical protein
VQYDRPISCAEKLAAARIAEENLLRTWSTGVELPAFQGSVCVSPRTINLLEGRLAAKAAARAKCHRDMRRPSTGMRHRPK